MSAHGLGDAAHDHSAGGAHEPERSGHGAHHWMMLACCVPMIVVVTALVAAGAVSVGWVLLTVACVGMMALMMFGMDRSTGSGPDR